MSGCRVERFDTIPQRRISRRDNHLFRRQPHGRSRRRAGGGVSDDIIAALGNAGAERRPSWRYNCASAGTNRWFGGEEESAPGDFADEYGPIFEETAAEFGAIYIPQVMKGFSMTKLRSDQIHPNSAGYRLIAERIAEKIKPLLHEG